jgi:aminoacrylate hydrolase
VTNGAPQIAGLHVEQYGPADAPPLILSPGLGGSGAYWAPQIDALARSHRVILYDHRGTARSDRALPDASVEAMADDMIAILDGLGIARADVIGHAAGGVAGLAMALKAPERVGRLVVVNGWASADRHFLRCFETRLALLRDSGIAAYVRAQPLFLYPAPWISGNLDRLDREAEHHVASFPGRDTVERRIAALGAFDFADRLQDIAAPVLVLSAKDDMLVPFPTGERLAAGLPNATLAAMPCGGHACNVTEPDLFDDLVLGFLNRTAATAAA